MRLVLSFGVGAADLWQRPDGSIGAVYVAPVSLAQGFVKFSDPDFDYQIRLQRRLHLREQLRIL
jgi:hypothetical protein